MAERSGTSPSTLFVAAWSYANAMELLLPSLEGPGNHNLNSPYALLAGFSLELAFKAYLRGNGMSDDGLRDLGHDLSDAFAAAERHGLQPTERPRLEDVLRRIRRAHKHHLMRYIPASVERIGLPWPDVALLTIRQLLDDVDQQAPQIAADMPD